MRRKNKLQIWINNYISLPLWYLKKRIHCDYWRLKDKYTIRKQRINRWGYDPAEQIGSYRTLRLPLGFIFVSRFHKTEKYPNGIIRYGVQR